MPDDDVLITRRLLRRAALRAALLSVGLALSVLLLVIMVEGPFASAPMLLLHGALTGLVAFPLTLVEAGVARRRDQGAPMHVAAALVIGLAALVGSSLAWSQARYTAALLEGRSLEEGWAATQSGGPITRRPLVATTIFVAPATGLGLAALLALRGATAPERLGIAPIGGILLEASFLGASGLPARAALDQVHLLAFSGAVAAVAVLAGLLGDALDARLSR